ncbi:MAG: hypothetical protein IJ533_09615 [Prevotella sp.]|nr:hypothetical protein [Prevotella sp.]
MLKNLFFIFAAIFAAVTSDLYARINYVPLYIVDTQPDVKTTRHAPAMPMIITQDGYKLTLPEIADSLTFIVIKDNYCVYQSPATDLYSTIILPQTLTAGDYEVRLTADTYYYYGFLTLEKSTENASWENITLLGSNTSQQVILDNILGLNVVEYNMKPKNPAAADSLVYLSEEAKDTYMAQYEQSLAELRAQRRFGLLPEQLETIYPQLVERSENGSVGINYIGLIPILVSCIQELKVQLDNRTETMVDIIMSRSASASAVSFARAAIGNTLFSIPSSSVSESALVRFVLTDDVTNAYLAVTDTGGRLLVKVPVSPTATSAAIASGTLNEGVFLCTLFANGQNIGTKRLVKTK